jgi:hypothetical protein
MNAKTFIAALIGGVTFFLLGWVLFGMALAPMMESHTNMSCMRAPADANLPMLGAANLLWGLVFAYIFSKSNVAGFNAGATMGVILSVIIGLSIDLYMYATSTLYTDFTIVGLDLVGNAVMGAIVGGIMGWWLGRK